MTTNARMVFQACLYTTHAEHEAEPAEIHWVTDGRGKEYATVAGCRPGAPWMIKRFLSERFALVGGDLWTVPLGGTVAVLANGRKIVRGESLQGCYALHMDSLGGERIKTILDAAILYTPYMT